MSRTGGERPAAGSLTTADGRVAELEGEDAFDHWAGDGAAGAAVVGVDRASESRRDLRLPAYLNRLAVADAPDRKPFPSRLPVRPNRRAAGRVSAASRPNSAPRDHRMFSWLTNPTILLGGLVLAAIQFARRPALAVGHRPAGFDRVGPEPGRPRLRPGRGVLGIGLAVRRVHRLQGRLGQPAAVRPVLYGAVLHLQLLIDLFLLCRRCCSPGAGRRAGRWRSPRTARAGGSRCSGSSSSFGVLLTWIAVVIPYFTFGDDYKMMKQIGFDVVMLAAVLFGVLAASMSISEEIEGRTAVTLMSKPVNRRQFLIGKFLGILMACLVDVADPGLEPERRPCGRCRSSTRSTRTGRSTRCRCRPRSRSSRRSSRAVVPWTARPGRSSPAGPGCGSRDAFAHTLGIALGFGQVMILVAIASALATRLPFVVNLVLCLVIYFLGHLAPVVVR